MRVRENNGRDLLGGLLHQSKLRAGRRGDLRNDVPRPLQEVRGLRHRIAFRGQGRPHNPLDGSRAVGQQHALVIGAVLYLRNVARLASEQDLTCLALHVLGAGERRVTEPDQGQVLHIEDVAPDHQASLLGLDDLLGHGVRLHEVTDG